MRIAIVLDANTTTAIDDFDDASHYFFHLWGGLHNAIVPSTGGTISAPWYRLLEILDPDCIYAVPTLSETIIAKINRELAPAVFRNALEQDHRRSGHLHVFGMVREQPVRITTLPRTIAALASTLFTPYLIYLFGASGDDPYKKFIARNFGTLSDTVDIQDAFRDVKHWSTKIHKQDAHTLFGRLAERGNHTITPDRLSSFHANPPTDGRGGKYEHRFTIVVGDSLDDLALARAIRMFETHQGGRRSIWLPSALCNHRDAITLLRQFIVKSFWSADNIKRCQIVSLSLDGGVLSDLTDRLNEDWQVSSSVEEIDRDSFGFPEISDSFRPAAARAHGERGFDVNLTTAHQCSLVDQVGVLGLPLPEFLRGVSAQDELMIDLEIPFLRNDRSHVLRRSGPPEPWRLPRRQGLAAAFVQSGGVSRITHMGLPSALTTAATDRLQIRVPSPFELFDCWITDQHTNECDTIRRPQRRFVRWDVSDEGQFLQALVRLFGSPYACGRTLADTFWGTALRQMAIGASMASDVSEASVRRGLSLLQEHEGGIDLEQPDGKDKAARFLARHVRASIKQPKGFLLKQICELFCKMKKEAPQGHWYWADANWKELIHDGELDDLVDDEILRLGVRVRCEECLIDQWIHVDDIAAIVTCRGCGARIRLGATPTWSYQLNTLVAEAIRRRGVIAVTQALYSAERDARAGTFVVLPSLDIFEADANQCFTDIDLLYFADRELVLGEVKADPTRFSQAGIDKLSALAVDLLPNRVVLAAPGENWPIEIEERAHRLSAEQSNIGVIWEIRRLKWTE